MGIATASRAEALAEAQYGVLSRAQCLGLDMTSDAIRWMLHSRRWQRVHLGVYATHAGPLDWPARVSAALFVFRDRTRDNITTVSGKVTLRFGWADVDVHTCEVAQDVAVLLWSRGWRGRLKRCGAGCRVSPRTT